MTPAWRGYALDAVLMGALVCGGVAVHAVLGQGATWAYAGVVLLAVWWALGRTPESP